MNMKTNNLSMLGLIFSEIKSINKASIKMLLFIFFMGILVLIPIAVVSQIYQIPISKLTSDPIAIAGIHPLSGVLSNLGIILWCAATFSCALAATVIRVTAAKKVYLFLLFSSFLSAYLMLDDLFQFHEDLSGEIGLNQKVIYVLLFAAVFTYLISFRKILFQTNFLLLLTAFAFLSLSILTDTIIYKVFGNQLGDWLYLIEDGSKWIGIVFWSSYFFHTSFKFIMKSTEASSAAN